MTENKNVRVRFAPSPTGALHIGGGHTALFNWLWARHTGGRFILRVEDTDRVRSTKEYEETIMSGMRWLGLDWDEGPDRGGDYGPYRQSERLDLYRQYARQLLDEGRAYRDGEAIVFKVEPGQDLSFDDCVYGRIESMSDGLKEKDSEKLKDIVLIKSDGMPTYNYAVVVDDHLMAITHVIRGEDHISNTPKQILIYRALGWETPRFAHLPMILGKDKKKLSKRLGATSVYEYRDLGYMPDSVFNFLALLGWFAGDDHEIFTRQEAADLFELSRVTRKPAVLDVDKLNFINQEHLKRLDPMTRLAMVRPFWEAMGLPVKEHGDEWLAEALTLMEGRGRTAREMAEFTDYFLSFEPVKARWDGSALTADERGLLKEFFAAMTSLSDWTPAGLEAFARSWTAERNVKMKDYAMPLRWALTGMKVSPGIFDVAVHLGRDEVKRRLSHYGLI
ncbi:glutamate--tRNA ligase [Fretibacterium fastidiosum]|uniref:Glutamate--tRNA ligase n=1 Tax=Fretibacterium fastidiosum TaxID=651822 RepID=A0AB94IY25_9BACT|nr:glutamate--tRNA ligase [Fretibacterium fastidiosum]CBL28648.1 glutamyl-tRNA synthetase, bacterial family [Fretibacterium fastidiosum]